MKYYLDITLLSSSEIDHHFLLSRVYQQIHLGLVEIKDADNKVQIGVAFPDYNARANRLGSKLRLLAKDSAILENFNANNRLNRLSDYIDITSICDVPTTVVTYASFHRIQPKSNNKSHARRKAKRENITCEQALAILEKYPVKPTKAPYLYIKSLSSSEKFSLYIDFTEHKTGNSDANFGTYGLSKHSTVPVF